MNIFSTIDFGMLQTMMFPVIKAIGGPDIQDIISGKSEALAAAGDGFGQIAALFDMAAEAAADGILSNDEINAIVEKAETLDDAYEAVRVALLGATAE
jgi:hypothetical protein